MQIRLDQTCFVANFICRFRRFFVMFFSITKTLIKFYAGSLKFFSGKISCFLASNFVSLAEPTDTFPKQSFESVIVGYILSLESYVTAPFGRFLLPARKDILYGQNKLFSS